MAVFTVLAAALWRFYPRYKFLYLLLVLVLAIALITTNYHFLSDVIAGAYLGVIVGILTYKLLDKQHIKYN
jgi:membrane-associated phospholipid phosphatase